jgi:hypothetical protein
MTRKRGRPYQPLPQRQNRTYALVIIFVILILIIGFGILSTVR